MVVRDVPTLITDPCQKGLRENVPWVQKKVQMAKLLKFENCFSLVLSRRAHSLITWQPFHTCKMKEEKNTLQPSVLSIFLISVFSKEVSICFQKVHFSQNVLSRMAILITIFSRMSFDNDIFKKVI